MTRLNPGRRLADFMSDSSRTVTELARELDVTHTMVGHLLAGRRSPGLGLATSIETLSASWAKGPIRAVEWASMDVKRDHKRESAPARRARGARAAA